MKIVVQVIKSGIALLSQDKSTFAPVQRYHFTDINCIHIYVEIQLLPVELCNKINTNAKDSDKLSLTLVVMNHLSNMPMNVPLAITPQ
ncbi:hypothetical protein N7468_008582 [Penicillium chermesinum]|uniref:Uncharacterized protein n=1 Tax=Penicillium chermesinum TaxID=63820 RepID=A0A9W9NQ27_9EURO|nr:uncharacterized protein N7468_008582 [Penicillium chermesinum]KAJ5224040.1 hypothetical protein N7468_008582 [Penicillium chermesinum]KAJ6155145.1 hypothetical protein N7470_005711 [Penicillium chermesinum]